MIKIENLSKNMEGTKITIFNMIHKTLEEEHNLTSKKDPNYSKRKLMIKFSDLISAAFQEQMGLNEKHLHTTSLLPELSRYPWQLHTNQPRLTKT